MKNWIAIVLLIGLVSLSGCNGGPDIDAELSSTSLSPISSQVASREELHSQTETGAGNDAASLDKEGDAGSADPAMSGIQEENAANESNSESKEDENGKSSGNQDSLEAGAPGGTMKKQFVVDLVDMDGNITGEPVRFSIQIPTTWTATANALFMDDRKIADIFPCVFFEGESTYEKILEQYPDADPVKEVSLGQHTGKYYHLQYAAQEGGMAAIQNELIYYLNIGDRLIHIKFYPAFGLGIGTQREEFEAVLSSIE